MIFNRIFRFSSIVVFLTLFSCNNNADKAEAKQQAIDKVVPTRISEISSNRSTTPEIISTEEDSSELLISKTVLNRSLKVSIPKVFKLMPRDMVNKKYPMVGKRPSEVYSNEKYSVNVTFNLTNNQAGINDLPKIKNALETSLTPASWTVYKSSLETINGRQFIIRKFVSPAADGPIYNHLFITSVDNRLLMGSFNCLLREKKDWELIGDSIIASLEILN